MNKKGEGEKVLAVWWILVIVIITIGIVSGVLSVFGRPIDIREAEADILRDKVVDCLVEDGKLNSAKYQNLISGDLDSLLSVCKIDLRDKTEKYEGTEQYALQINKKDFGKVSFFQTCDLDEDVFPRCSEITIYVLDGGKGKFLTIKSAVNKKEKNVK